MKKYFIPLTAFLLCLILSACNNYGKEKDFNGVELYHTAVIPDALADSLGKFLVDEKFADGQRKSVQITKTGDKYQFRFVVQDGKENDAEIIKNTKVFAGELSSGVFGGAPLEVHLCDDHFKTLKVVVANDYGKQEVFDGVELFYTKNITSTEVNALGKYLISSSFADGRRKSAQITKSGDTYQFKIVTKKGMNIDADYRANAKLFARQISTSVFNNAPVEIFLCDEYFSTLSVIPM